MAVALADARQDVGNLPVAPRPDNCKAAPLRDTSLNLSLATLKVGASCSDLGPRRGHKALIDDREDGEERVPGTRKIVATGGEVADGSTILDEDLPNALMERRLEMVVLELGGRGEGENEEGGELIRTRDDIELQPRACFSPCRRAADLEP